MPGRRVEASLSSRVVFTADVLFRDLEGEAVLLDLKSGRYYGLNELGTRIWELLTRTGRLDRVYEKLLEEYEVAGATLEKDLVSLVGELGRRGLLEIRAPDAMVSVAEEDGS